MKKHDYSFFFTSFISNDSFTKIKKMNIHSCCLACLIGQIEKAYTLLAPDTPNEQIVKVQKEAMIKLATLEAKRMPYYGKALYNTFNNAFGQKDPYKQVKRFYNQKILEFVPILKEFIEQSPSPLETAISISILGNTIDFGTPHSINIEEDIHNFNLDQLAINDFEQLVVDLEKANKILIIADNCGEVVFDMILLEYLNQNFPEKQLYYAVRGGPVINDCTKEDIEELHLEKFCSILESSASPGVILEQSPQEFQTVFHAADLLFSKGQGNYEALDDIEPLGGKLYFLLKAKCSFVADLLKVPLGSLVLSAQVKHMA